jgi:hypothetical protein
MSHELPWRSMWGRAAAVVAALVACLGDANATSCSQQCGGAPCTQSCSVNSNDCGTGCYGGGCPGSITCEEFGNVNDCTYSKTVNCKDGSSGGGPGDECIPGGCDPQGVVQPGDTAKWAVIAFRDRCNGASSCEAEVLASSNPVFGARAAAELVARQAAALDGFLPKGGAARPGETPARKRVDFHIDPGTCIAARVDLSFAEPRTFAPSATSRATLFRVVTDAAGFVTAAQALFSEAADEVAELSGYLETFGRLETTESGPFEAFVVLKISTKGNLGYMLSGAKYLAAPMAKPDRGANALR